MEYAWAPREHYGAQALLNAETALAWRNENPGWFLIRDDIATDAAMAAANRLLGRPPGGHVVLTNRLNAFPRGVERLDLDNADGLRLTRPTAYPRKRYFRTASAARPQAYAVSKAPRIPHM
jgi:hypothetical protein